MSNYNPASQPPFDAPPSAAGGGQNPRQTLPPAPQPPNSGGSMAGAGGAGVGGGMNGGGGMAAASRPWPNVGEQMDMNVLWELVNNLAEVHQGIREQTAGVLQRVQMIQTRSGESHGNGNGNGSGNEGAVGEVEKTNGDGGAGENGHADSLDFTSLRTQLTTAESNIQTLTAQATSTTALIQNYESSLSSILTQLRPFASGHETALRAQKAHYLSLLDRERTANLELRLEMSRKDECMTRALEWARKAQEAQREVVGPYIRKIAALRTENGVLASICGVAPMGVGDEGGSESSGEDGG